MNNPSNKSSTPKSLFTTSNIVLAGIFWAAAALLYFLLFSAKLPGAGGIEQRADWYVFGTNIFEAVAFLAAALLCFRNWRSPQIVSGRNVWLGIGLGMFSYFLGGIIFGYWEIVLQKEPIVSPADIFFVATYLFLIWGMVLAVVSRRLNLEKWQWGIVAGIAVIGLLVAWYISQQQGGAGEEQLTGLEATIAPILNWFYVGCDLALLVIATTLLLAFWGGRVSLSWRIIAAAAFSLYIGDMWFKYATSAIPNYQSGEILEVFWIFSGVLFGIGAALEYGTSLSRSRRAGGRKRA
jgi:hypothetical protein